MTDSRDKLIEDEDRRYMDTGRVTGDTPRRTAQEALGDALAGGRPWHVEIGWDGAATAVVDIHGYLVCDCEGPRGSYTLPTERGAGEANAELIVRAVNAYRREDR